jgi:hypothetical protein
MKTVGTMQPLRNTHPVSWTVGLLGLVLASVAFTGCGYIVGPLSDTASPPPADNGWSGVALAVSQSSGSLHVDLAITNNTGDWSAMDVAATVAKVVDSSGSSHDCATDYVGTSTFVNSGGWYLPPGFVMKGYTGGTLQQPKAQPLFVECSGVSQAAGQKLSIDYRYITGAFNYYVATKPKSATMKVDLDKVAADTKFPVAADGPQTPIAKIGDKIPAINNCSVILADAKRTDTGLELDWKSLDPVAAATYIHIGKPPVIGSDGILYGYYLSPHLADVPVTPAGGDTEWSTVVTVPKEVTGLYVLLPVETQQSKYFVDHVVDITDK